MRRSHTYLLLSLNDMRELGVRDPGVQLTLHEGRSLVVFDVSQVATLRHFDVFGKALRGKSKLLEMTRWRWRTGAELMHRSRLQYLLLEVANGVLVSVSEEIEDVVFDVVLLQVVHQVGTVALILKTTETRQRGISILI